MKTLLLAGGGHAHIEVLRRIGLSPIGDTQIVVVSPDTHMAYSGMIPGLLAGHYTWDECHIDLRSLCTRAGADFVVARVNAIDLSARQVTCADGRTIEFDILSLDVGSAPNAASVPGAVEQAVPVKSVSILLDRWKCISARTDGVSPHAARVVVVGGGAGGVEVALAMQHRLNSVGRADAVEVVLIARNLLPTHPGRVQELLRGRLASLGVTVLRNRMVTGVARGEVHYSTGETERADLIVWATGAAAPAWIARTGLALDDHGFVAVNDQLQSVSHPFVFAAGDVASLVTGPLPKAGVFAVRQGPRLAENLRAYLTDRPLCHYRPQRWFLSLISAGERRAVASYGRFSWQGRWVWRWKDRIDRAFMRKYSGRIGDTYSDAASKRSAA